MFRSIRFFASSLRRGSLNRRLFVLAFVCVVFLLSIIDTYAPKPYEGYQRQPNIITRLPLYAFKDRLVSSDATSTTTSEATLPTIRPASPLKDSLFPIRDPNRTSGNVWMDENHRQLRALFTCIELDTCGPNQGKVVILHSHHFKGGLWGWVGGEDVWARSVILALRNMGYTYLYAQEMERALQLYQLFPDLVRAVLMEDGPTIDCFEDRYTCQKNGANPDGIPVWKIFAFYFWAHPNNPLGPKWTLAPENYSTEWDTANTYLGYSVEPSCKTHPNHPDLEWFVPHDKRPDGQAYIMAKRLSYFAPQSARAWSLEAFEEAARRTDVRFIAGAMDDSEERGHELDVPKKLPDMIVNYGLLPQDQFVDAISHSRLLIGVGNPVLSPTPYEALCLGVPFINPILDWDKAEPTNRRSWTSQHTGLKYMDPPYVYNVFKDDNEGFARAVEQALANPIDKYILPRMTMSAVEERLAGILEHDWKKEAETLLEERRKNGGKLFTL